MERETGPQQTPLCLLSAYDSPGNFRAVEEETGFRQWTETGDFFIQEQYEETLSTVDLCLLVDQKARNQNRQEFKLL